MLENPITNLNVLDFWEKNIQMQRTEANLHLFEQRKALTWPLVHRRNGNFAASILFFLLEAHHYLHQKRSTDPWVESTKIIYLVRKVHKVIMTTAAKQLSLFCTTKLRIDNFQ